MKETVEYPPTVETFLEIVPINNPSKREEELTLWLVDQLTILGVDSLEQDSIGNIYARINSNIPNNEQYLMFTAHLDSVMPCENIEPEIEEIGKDSLITSSGETILSADDKAGISAVIEALKRIKNLDIEHPNIELVFTAQEEIGLKGAKELDYTTFKSEIAYAVDGEAPVGTVITQGPSQKRFKLEFTGKSSHAGMAPEKGVNAIMIAANFLHSIPFGRIDPVTTSNIGMINGGVANNVVPESVVLKGEVRSLYEIKLDNIISSYKIEAEKLVASFPGSGYIIEDEYIYHGFYIDITSKVVQIVKLACDSLGIQTDISSIGSGSDANIFNANDIETVILGAGFKNSHSLQEQISFSQLELLTALIVEIIKKAV